MRSTTAARAVALGLAAMTVAFRLAASLFGAFNFNPIGALGIFGGAKLKLWQACALPIGIMIATDLSLSFLKGPDYGLLHPSRPWVYGSYLAYVLIGRLIVGASKNPAIIAAAALAGAGQFFLVTNFHEWLAQPELYSRNFSGLLASYVAALPFAYNSLAGDLIFTPLAFFVHILLTRSAAEERLDPVRG